MRKSAILFITLLAVPCFAATIGLSTNSFNFNVEEGGTNPDDQVLTIYNAGSGTLNWTADESCSWLTVVPISGSSTGQNNLAILSVDTTSMTWGQYSCELTISDPLAENNPQIVTVNLDINGPIIGLSANTINFSADEGGADPDDQILTIHNAGVGTLNWTITETCSWLNVDPDSGSSTGEPDDVALSVDISGLPVGRYSCDITVSDPLAENDPQIVTVNLDVVGPVIGLSADSFNFNALQDGADPDDQVLTITNIGGGTLNWTISETCDWLTVYPQSGSSTGEPDDVTLSINIAGLGNGGYSCDLIISDPLAENDPQTVNVELQVRHVLSVPSQYPTIQSAVDAAASGDTIIVADGTYTGEGNRDIQLTKENITLCSQNGPNLCIIDCQYLGRGMYIDHNDVKVKGFTIKNGYASSVGGGIYAEGADPVISDCIITENSAGIRGGGIYGGTDDSVLTDCLISGNTAVLNEGGGLAWYYGAITNCTIIGNSAVYAGGLSKCSGTISNCKITENSASRNGGGLWVCDGNITDCTITGNSADAGGGLYHCDGPITNCTITDNLSNEFGGGGLVGCSGTITNCTITGNWASEKGGGLYYCYGSITNCIIWGNTSDGLGDQLWESSTPTYSCIQDWTAGGTGNINDDPLFVDISAPNPLDWDLHLLPGSPCIDTGTNSPPGGLPIADLDGNPRPIDGNNDGIAIADMGAYESFQPTAPWIWLSLNSFDFTALEGGVDPDDQILTIHNAGVGTLNWTITETCDWLDVYPQSGTSSGEPDDVALTVSVTGLTDGFYSCQLMVSDPNAMNNPQMVTVDLEIIEHIDYLDFALFSLDWLADTRQLIEPNEAAWWKFDEGAGAIAYDSSVYGHDGTLVGDPNWITDDLKNALSFDGVNDYVEAADYKGITNTLPRTCCAWIKIDLDENDSDYQNIISWGDNEYVGNRWDLMMRDHDLNSEYQLRLAVSGGSKYGNTDLNDNTWHHVAATWQDDGTPDVADVKLYVDGVEESSYTTDSQTINTAGSQNVQIAAFQANSPFDGLIDDVRIYDFALTDEMIRQIYNGQSPAGLVCTGDYLTTDLNDDCIVDINDLRIFAQNWLWPE